MVRLRDSSEIQEAAKIFTELIAQHAFVAPITLETKKPKRVANVSTRLQPVRRRKAARVQVATDGSEDSAAPVYRGDRLKGILFAMCKRGGFEGAVLADASGLPLAVHNSPVEDEAIAAFTTVLGDTLEKAAKLLGQHDANNISLDINYTEKAVLRQFSIDELPYFIMTICPQEIDERDEVELSIDQIASILKP